MGKDYSAQQRYLRANYVRFSLDLRPELLEEFRAACRKNGTTPTTEIKKFVADYCAAAKEEQQGGEQS